MLSPDYIAGFFDGEGCIGLYKRLGSFHLQVSLSNTNQRILRLIYAQFPSGSFSSRKRNHRINQQNWSMMFGITYSNQQAADFLRCIAPFVQVKKEQVEFALEFLENRDSMPTNRATFLRDKIAELKGEPTKCLSSAA